MRRNRLLLAACLLAATLLACSSDASEDDPTYTFKDATGRTCSRTRSGQTASCDKPPTPVTRVFKVCASCCSGNTSSSTSADCANVTCTTDADCAAEGGTTCGNGRCQTAL